MVDGLDWLRRAAGVLGLDEEASGVIEEARDAGVSVTRTPKGTLVVEWVEDDGIAVEYVAPVVGPGLVNVRTGHASYWHHELPDDPEAPAAHVAALVAAIRGVRAAGLDV